MSLNVFANSLQHHSHLQGDSINAWWGILNVVFSYHSYNIVYQNYNSLFDWCFTVTGTKLSYYSFSTKIIVGPFTFLGWTLAIYFLRSFTSCVISVDAGFSNKCASFSKCKQLNVYFYLIHWWEVWCCTTSKCPLST